MSDKQTVYVQQAPSYIFSGVNMQIHLPGKLAPPEVPAHN